MLFSPLGDTTVNGVQIPTMDGQFSYESEFVFETFELLGKEGRAKYTVFHILDYLFVISYCFLMIQLIKPVTPDNAKWIWIIFPLLPALFDFAENTLIEVASANYPAITLLTAKTISLLTTLKWSLGLLWFLVYVILFIIHFKKKHSKEIPL